MATKRKLESIASIQARTDLDARAAKLHQAKLEPTTVTSVAPKHNDQYKVLEFVHGASSSSGVTVEVYLLNPGDYFEGFGGSRHGLVVRKTASLIIRTKHQAWGFRDVEYNVNDKEAWKAVAEGINLSYVEHFEKV